MKEQVQDTLLRLIKLFISMGFYLLSRAGNMIRSMMGKTPPGVCVAVHYHEVAPRHRARFARQMNILMHYAKPIAADHKEPLLPGHRYAALTFDDGFMSAIENAVPELVKRKIPATLFIPAGLLGTVPQWTEFGLDSVGNEIIAPAEMLLELPSDLITIGSHTMTHPWLPSLSEADAKIELSASRAELEKALNRDITLFSFPYGAFNEGLIELCREIGYERVFTVQPMLAFSDPLEFVTGRIAVNPTDWELEFRLKILGAYQWLPRVSAWKRNLIGKQLHESPGASNGKKGIRSARYGLN